VAGVDLERDLPAPLRLGNRLSEERNRLLGFAGRVEEATPLEQVANALPATDLVRDLVNGGVTFFESALEALRVRSASQIRGVRGRTPTRALPGTSPR
jgi:hypothetical protein